MSDAVLTEQRDRVLLITLNRPEAMNAINGALAHGLMDAVTRLNEDPGLTVGVVTGAGKGFSAGMDLKAFARGEDIGPFMNFAAPSQDEGREPGHGTLSRLIG
jgi:enoyl-CoA hydratase